MANKPIERCLITLITWEMQIKLQWGTTRHFLGWLSIKRLTTPSVGGDTEQLNLSYIAGGTTTLETVWRVSLKGKYIPPCDLYILLIGIYPEESICPHILYTNVHNSLIKKTFIFLTALGLSMVHRILLQHIGSFLAVHGLSSCGLWVPAQ